MTEEKQAANKIYVLTERNFVWRGFVVKGLERDCSRKSVDCQNDCCWNRCLSDLRSKARVVDREMIAEIIKVEIGLSGRKESECFDAATDEVINYLEGK